VPCSSDQVIDYLFNDELSPSWKVYDVELGVFKAVGKVRVGHWVAIQSGNSGGCLKRQFELNRELAPEVIQPKSMIRAGRFVVVEFIVPKMVILQINSGIRRSIPRC
jgi:hypothetical protein